MPSLADVAAFAPNDGASTTMSYTDYQIACMERGQTPLPYDKWVAAGKPAGPK